MKHAAALASIALAMFGCSRAASTPADVEADLLAEINTIKAIDNHAHPQAVSAPGEKPDSEFDALPIDAVDPFPLPVRLRPENAEFAGAWRAFFKYPYDDIVGAHLLEGKQMKDRLARERGDGYPAWILDQLGIETMLANRVAMGRGLSAPRFRWVPFADALMLPLSNEAAKRSNADYRGFYPAEERLLKRYLADLERGTLPLTLDEYVRQVVTPTLEREKKDGAMAVKFEAAYLRRLDFDAAAQADAARVYARYIGGGEPPAADYKTLQDYLFRQIAKDAGRLGMAVHIHVNDGVGGYYRQSGSNPSLLESAFNDASLRRTTFVIVHGGYPFYQATAALLSKPNVYADCSLQTLIRYPRELAAVLRNWLEAYPEKVLFGTDASPLSAELTWEEVGWLSATTGRRALAMALAAMMADHEVTRARALELARLVLRDNARKLYGL